MNSTNPFQIPSCLQRADVQLRRRERFRKGVVLAVAAVVALLVVLLIEGCMSEHSKTSITTVTPLGASQEAAVATAPVVVMPKPATAPAPAPVHAAITAPAVAPAPAPVVAAKTAAPALTLSGQVYVVKAGDTLGRIARQHHTTVKALKTVNSLETDNIAIGASLKLPAA